MDRGSQGEMGETERSRGKEDEREVEQGRREGARSARPAEGGVDVRPGK